MADRTPIDALLQKIAGEYDSLSRQLKVIAAYIERNRSSMALKRISDIATDCDVQPSAIVRFAQRFGFRGFSEMQEVFRQSFAEQASASQNYQQRIRSLIAIRNKKIAIGDMTHEFINASRSGLDDLLTSIDDEQMEAAVNLLQKADNIYVVGVRRAFPIASYIAYAMQHTNKRVHMVSGLGGMFREQVHSMRERDVMIAISFAPYGKETQYCARIARLHQARLLVITDSKLSPLARDADARLTVAEGSAFAFRSLASAICLCQALFIALAYRLELDLDESRDQGGYDD
jgi:DNA-binding MurR/RpiR family transcriptional regulator